MYSASKENVMLARKRVAFPFCALADDDEDDDDGRLKGAAVRPEAETKRPIAEMRRRRQRPIARRTSCWTRKERTRPAWPLRLPFLLLVRKEGPLKNAHSGLLKNSP